MWEHGRAGQVRRHPHPRPPRLPSAAGATHARNHTTAPLCHLPRQVLQQDGGGPLAQHGAPAGRQRNCSGCCMGRSEQRLRTGGLLHGQPSGAVPAALPAQPAPHCQPVKRASTAPSGWIATELRSSTCWPVIRAVERQLCVSHEPAQSVAPRNGKRALAQPTQQAHLAHGCMQHKWPL